MAKTVRLKLNRYLDERRISRYALAKMSGIKYQTIDHYYKNWVVRYDSATLGEIITALDCGIEDILEVVEEEEPEEPGGPPGSYFISAHTSSVYPAGSSRGSPAMSRAW